MKVKILIGCILAIAMLIVAVPALAGDLGVSPPSVELEVPGSGSAEAVLRVYYFDGDIGIALEDIPLRVEPTVLHVEASDEPVEIVLTIYGDNALGSKVFNGKIKFTALSKTGGNLAGVKILAKVTNVVDGVAPTKEPVVEEPVPETTLTEPVVEEPAPTTPPQGPPEPASPASSTSSQIKFIPLIGVIAGVVLLATLIIVLVRRRSY